MCPGPLACGVRPPAGAQGSKKQHHSDRAYDLKCEHRHLPSLYPDVAETCDRSPALAPGSYQSCRVETRRERLLDDLHDSVRARIDQHGAVVDYCIAIVLHAVLSWHFVISNACRRQLRTDYYVPVIPIGGPLAQNQRQ